MSIRLFLLERWLPGPIRRRTFRELVRLTARAFGAVAPELDHLPMDTAVLTFARFTRQEVERVHAAGPPESEHVRESLHLAARSLGAAIRRAAGIRTRRDAVRMLRLLYAAIGIDLEGDPSSGAITITRCAFSDAYTPDTCRFVSALDAGIADRVAGGAALAFTERITEGARCCRASLSWSARP